MYIFFSKRACTLESRLTFSEIVWSQTYGGIGKMIVQSCFSVFLPLIRNQFFAPRSEHNSALDDFVACKSRRFAPCMRGRPILFRLLERRIPFFCVMPFAKSWNVRTSEHPLQPSLRDSLICDDAHIRSFSEIL